MTADNINSPRHYTMGSIETITFVDQVCLYYQGDEAFSIGSAIKYLARAPHKGNKIEDLKKALWYVRHAVELAEKTSAGA
jgi:hypothetical protein